MSLLRGVFSVSFATCLSRILGFCRDLVMANVLGTGALADIFFFAFRLPNLFRAFFAEGAMNAVFIPYINNIEKKYNQNIMVDNINNIFTQLCLFLMIFVIVVEMSMPYLLKIFAPGVCDEYESFYTLITVSEIMFPYIFFISLVSFFTAVVQSKGYFLSSTLVQSILNICLIMGAVFLSEYTVTTIHALSISVFIAGCLQCIYMFVLTGSAGIGIKFVKPKIDKDTRDFYRRLPASIFCNAANQIGIWINTMLSSFLPGVISCFYYADRLVQLPLSLVVIAISVVLLPMLSKRVANEDNKQDIIYIQNRALELGFLFILPSTIAFTLMSRVFVKSIFFYGSFSLEGVTCTSEILQIVACSLPAILMSKVFLQVFFAYKDMKSPTIAAFISLIISVIINIILIAAYKHIGIAIATTVGAWVNAITLLLFLYRRGVYKVDDRLSSKVSFIIIATGIMSMAVAVLEALFEPMFEMFFSIKILCISIIVIVGILVYFLSLYLMKSYTLKEIRELINCV